MNYRSDTKCWKDLVWERELVSTPTAQPLISLDVLKLQSRIFPDSEETVEDPLFTMYCQTAEEQVESLAEIVLREKTYKLHMDAWAYSLQYYDRYMIRFEHRPIKSITHIKYYDVDDTQQTLLSAEYEVWLNKNPPYLFINTDNIPTLSSERTKRIECQYVAGHTGSLPAAAQLACLHLVAFWFQNREMYGRLPENSAEGRVFWSLINQVSWRLSIV
jgi:uncharacterized phiE125 gp8 family phage protein